MSETAKSLSTLQQRMCRQNFVLPPNKDEVIARHKAGAQLFAQTEQGVAVMSDFQANRSYIFVGALGKSLGLPVDSELSDAAFETSLFQHVRDTDLLSRHILELRFSELLKSLPVAERPHYVMLNTLHFSAAPITSEDATKATEPQPIPVLHRAYYLESVASGAVWLSLCLYTPFVELPVPINSIVNNETGRAVRAASFPQLEQKLLSRREREVLTLIGQGQSSRQIAEKLHIAVNTVSRHRQNILQTLKVQNTAAAVEIATRLHLLLH